MIDVYDATTGPGPDNWYSTSSLMQQCAICVVYLANVCAVFSVLSASIFNMQSHCDNQTDS